MKFCVLASGSRGNCIFVESHHGRFLIDVGLSARKIAERLIEKEIDPFSINSIILTHSHTDHVRGVGIFANRYHVPITAHPDTLDQIKHLLKPGQKLVPWREAFHLMDVLFTPFRVSHDCFPTVGYVIQENGRKLVLCTDLGVVTQEVKAHVSEAHALLLESNHDPDMLMNGSYPWHLKERIAGRGGHLSNHNAGDLLKEILHPGLDRVLLGHLSIENNTRELAYHTVLELAGNGCEPLLDVIEQGQISPMYNL